MTLTHGHVRLLRLSLSPGSPSIGKEDLTMVHKRRVGQITTTTQGRWKFLTVGEVIPLHPRVDTEGFSTRTPAITPVGITINPRLFRGLVNRYLGGPGTWDSWSDHPDLRILDVKQGHGPRGPTVTRREAPWDLERVLRHTLEVGKVNGRVRAGSRHTPSLKS